ncbi:hypothetical protein [Leisingera sp. NJS201]|uniref:hypothetical protein n=1 Tax=Leisingera sp. NJS201 TaxID=2508306 RepID=UPI001430B8EF|nr:hypothetical protein [Leisingera sp. NJS201]
MSQIAECFGSRRPLLRFQDRDEIPVDCERAAGVARVLGLVKKAPHAGGISGRLKGLPLQLLL